MDAREFRLGNLAQDKLTKEILVCCGLRDKTEENNIRIDFTVINRDKFPLPNGWELEPIPLNEEWLVKFGFKGRPFGSRKYIYKINNITSIIIDVNNNFAKTLIPEHQPYIQQVKDIVYFPKLKHVHQLQNLYFALTGEELKTN